MTQKPESKPYSRGIILWSLVGALASALFAILYGIPSSQRQRYPSDGETVPVQRSPAGPFMTDACRIYWAPSSVKGVAGMGLFTVADYPAGAPILNGADGPSIPVWDYLTDNPSPGRSQWINLFDNYWWGRGVADHTLYEADTVIDYQIMFGALPNHHCALDSLDFVWPFSAYNDQMVHGPGRGATSYHSGRFFKTMRELKAGDELFLNYGHCEHDPNDPEWARYIPQNDDFKEGIAEILRLWNQVKDRSEEAFDGILRNFTRSKHFEDRHVDLLPSSLSQIKRIMKEGRRDLKINLAKELTTNPRSVGWIRENGFCAEALIPGPSQIPDAGQGAISQWKIREGETIVPVPLLHLIDRDALNFEGDDRVASQLLLNYCFGHDESSILLCPASNGILLNHCSAKTKINCAKGPNAAVRWARWDKDSEEWLGLSLEELKARERRGLTLEVVATRDIEPGEEVFIDYGDAWERAWTDHVEGWKVDDSDKHMSVTALNKDNGPIKVQFISNDLRKVVDHPSIFTGCLYFTSEEDDSEDYDREHFDWKKLQDTEILEMFSDDGEDVTGDYASHMDGEYWPCDVISEEDDKGSEYTVRIHMHPQHVDMELLWDTNDLPRILTNYPRSSIRYFYRPYQSDLHLVGAFRYPPGLPDVWPEKWMDRPK